MIFLLLLMLLFPSVALAAGNETINPIPDSNKATFRVDSQNFWKNEIPQILHKYVSKDFVFSGGLHSTSGTCTSPSFSLEGFTNSGNRVTADSLGGAVTVNYGAASIGGNCTSDVCWVAGSGSDAATLGNFKQSGTSNIYADCVSSSEPVWPTDSVKLMKVTLSGGAISLVEDLRQSPSLARTGDYDFTDPLYGGKCDGVTDTWSSLQTLINTVPTGSKIILPTGVCILSQPITFTRTMSMEGKGITHTILRQTAPNLPVISVTEPHHIPTDIFLSQFSVDHDGTTPVAGGDGIVFNSLLNHAYLEHISASKNWRGFVLGCVAFGYGGHLEASNNNSHGIEFVYPNATCGVPQWQVHHTLSQLNKGAGYGGFSSGASAAPSGVGPFLDHTHSFGNGGGGYVFIGSPGHTINDIWLYNVASSGDDPAGVYLDTYGAGHIVSNPWIELQSMLENLPRGWPITTAPATHIGNCLSVTQNNYAGLVIMGGNYWNCSHAAVALYADYSSLIGGTSLGAGNALAPELSRRASVSIGGNGVTVTGHTFNYFNTGTLSYIHLTGTLTQMGIGHNNYAPGLTPSQFVNATEASLGAATYPVMAGGLSIHSNTPAAPGLGLYDATGAVGGLKVLRVSLGHLQILNAAGSAAIHNLSDVGTPSWPTRGGAVVIADANITANIALAPNEPDTNYKVQVTVESSVSNPAAGAFTVIGVNKLTTGFELAVSAAPGAGKSVTYNWLVYR